MPTSNSSPKPPREARSSWRVAAAACPVRRWAQAAPDAAAVQTANGRWTYAALDGAVTSVMRALEDEGIGAGTRVALRLPRSPELIALFWAIWRQRAVAVPLSRRLPPSAAAEAAQRGGSDVLVTPRAHDEKAAQKLGLRTIDPESLGERPPPSASVPAEPVAMTPDQEATRVFTSGSTGPPKAAVHTWGNHIASAAGSNANLPVQPGDRWLLSLPCHHVGGLAILVRCALGGGAVLLPGAGDDLAETVDRLRPTHASLVATQLHRLLQADADGVAGMAGVLVGGGPVPDAMLQEAQARGWPVHTTYGCTEMASQITTTPPGADGDALQTAGVVLRHRRVRIAGDGEILVRGAPLFRGYWVDGALDDPRTAEGWYPTGDRGRLTADGRLRVTGRTDHMFISGGENIQPEEVERAIEQLPQVARAVVVPVPDAEFGRRPVAFVEPAAGHAVPNTLADVLAEHLPRFKIPDAVFSLPEMARQAGMKVNRRQLEVEARKLLDP